MNNVDKWINGVNLKQIAHAVIDTDKQDNLDAVPDKGIIWAKTEYIDEVFNVIKEKPKTYTLITHCADHAIDEETFRRKPSNIVKWYAQNVNFKHDDLIPVPIGIENHFGPHKGTELNIDYFNSQTEANYKISNKIINCLYCNFNFQTNQNRYNVGKILTEKNIGKFDSRRPSAEYCEEIKKFLFVASPRGNGIDCHRTWEALYLGSIPIVERHIMFDRYKNLPIIQIDSWENLTMDSLAPYIEDYRNNKIFADIKELDLQYHLDKIRNNE